MFYSFLVVSMSGAKKNSKKGSPYRKSGDKFIGTVTANKVSKKRNSQPSIANYTQKQSKPQIEPVNHPISTHHKPQSISSVKQQNNRGLNHAFKT